MNLPQYIQELEGAMEQHRSEVLESAERLAKSFAAAREEFYEDPETAVKRTDREGR